MSSSGGSSGGSSDAAVAGYLSNPASATYGAADATIGALVALSTSASRAALNKLGGILLGPSNGVDDTATINNAMASGLAKKVIGRPGETYIITAPLVGQSGVALYMTAATVQLKAGSNCQMVTTPATTTPNRTVADGAITTGTTALSSATANFTGADVGRSVVVALAGPNAGMFDLAAKIVSVTDASHVVLDTAAQATVAAASVSIYTRDQNVNFIDGTYDRQSNAGAGANQHSFFIRRVDGLVIDIEGFLSSGVGPKYAVMPGDVTAFFLRVRNFNHVSDGIHVRGPAHRGVICNTAGTTGDDFVVLSTSDNTRVSDGAGDVSDVEVYDLRPAGLTTNAFKLYGNPGTKISGIHLDGDRGGLSERGLAIGASDVTGVTLDDIVCENIRTDGAQPVTIQGCTAGTIRLRTITATDATATDVLSVVNVASTATVDFLEVDELEVPNFSATAAGGALVNVAGTVTDLQLGRYKATLPASGAAVLLTGAGAVVTRAMLSKLTQTNGGALVKAATAGQTLGEVWLSDAYATGTSFLVDTATTTVVQLSNVELVAPGSGSFNVRATGNLSIFGSGGARIGGNMSTTAGYALRVNCRDFNVNVGLVTVVVVGDELVNSNAAVAPFVTGPLIYYDGAWRPRAPYAAAGTAVLVAGTKAVADAKITASSRIRLTCLVPGGTLGILSYIRTAGTGITINSTNAADTSTVYYEVVSY